MEEAEPWHIFYGQLRVHCSIERCSGHISGITAGAYREILINLGGIFERLRWVLIGDHRRWRKKRGVHCPLSAIRFLVVFLIQPHRHNIIPHSFSVAFTTSLSFNRNTHFD